jgi:hypothetical protein
LLSAKPMDGISYTRRSILKGVQLLKEGLVKRVGDGTNIYKFGMIHGSLVSGHANQLHQKAKLSSVRFLN